jgi:hypothetical protein
MPFPNPDTQFKPGKSGNPKGRPVSPLTALRGRLGTIGDDGRPVDELFVETLVTIALAGDFRAIKMVLDIVDGKVRKPPRR